MTKTIHDLTKRAVELGCTIVHVENYPDGPSPDDRGPWWLCDAESKYVIWGCGLSLDLIDEALDCFAKELATRDQAFAWRGFGSRSLGDPVA